MMLHLGRELTKDDYVIHTCGNNLCCNPDHLQVTTSGDRDDLVKANQRLHSLLDALPAAVILVEQGARVAGLVPDRCRGHPIGIAQAAYYPDITLSGSINFVSTVIAQLFQIASAVWSVGPQMAGTLVDGGSRGAQVDSARAAYDQSVATYRQTVLTAFQQVEDALVQQRVLEQQERVQRAAVAAARDAERLSLNQYRLGTVPYTTVVQTQNAALSAEQTLLTIRLNRLTASANLVLALGGGWRDSDLPSPTPIGGIDPKPQPAVPTARAVMRA